MSGIGTCEFVIGIIHDRDTWYYVGETDDNGKPLKANEQFSSFLVDAKRYDDTAILMEELDILPDSVACKVLEIQKCPKCGKEFTDYPALSRIDNETEICPECGVREALQKYMEFRVAKNKK